MASLQSDFYETNNFEKTWLESYYKEGYKEQMELYGIAFYWTI